MNASGWAVGKKVGRKPAFTEHDIIRAAMDEGLDTFTLAAVADRIGVGATAIYRLFGSRDEIVTACLDAVAATIALPEPGMGWREVLRQWANECWRICEDHPGLPRVVYSYAPAVTRITEVLDAYAASLACHDITSGQAGFALDFLGDTVFACHLGVQAMRAADRTGATGLDQVRAALGGTHSILHPHESWQQRGLVDTKVEFILTGLEHHWPEV
ncbi:TetR/AcrR family transcriptional regulator [Nocardia sp. 2]|uniref:TetR/AcrR family transcriptional regulator n=1 Tax=Nocardia acididurans TaxID=2802282 RepID=A0ABS1MFR5_9NOCA|nr:TetR/AcrR family transcriptional regulator [Nocardia acididurans]MBL1079457.1 TetR/AcrR family transcriptional regulator [Nocardia acididurans]